MDCVKSFLHVLESMLVRLRWLGYLKMTPLSTQNYWSLYREAQDLGAVGNMLFGQWPKRGARTEGRVEKGSHRLCLIIQTI